MLRVLLAGVLAVSAAGACKGKADAPAAAVGSPAGKVVEVAGKVSATREGKTRELAIGNEIFADDQIATAADATVTIELFHNGARWAVTSNKQARVDTSLAWGLDKQQAAKTVDHNSAAAGRNAERSAADTSATVVETEKVDMEDRGASAAGNEVGGAPAPGGPMPPPPPAADEPKPIERERTDTSKDKKVGSKGGATRRDDLAPRTVAKPASEAPRQAPRTPEVASVAITPQLVAERQRAAFAKCLDPQAPKVTVTIKRARNKTTVSLGGPGNVTDKVRSCMDVVAQQLAWPDPAATFEVTLRFD